MSFLELKRQEEVQQLNILQSVVKSEWGRKTMSPLFLRTLSFFPLLLSRPSFLCQKNDCKSRYQHCKDVQIK